MTYGDMLFYKYISTCPQCKNKQDHYLVLANWRQDCDTSIVGQGSCKCGYVGLVDLRYVGRFIKRLNKPINPDLIDPY